MAKLHELLAVESNLRGQAEACRADLKNTFEKKVNHFAERVVTYKPKKEGEPEKQETQLSLQTTIAKELAWIGEKVSKAIDMAHQVDIANTEAKADVVLESGDVLLKDVPATSLLQLEKRIREVQELVGAIPTLDPSKGFSADPSRGEGIFRARDDERLKTQKEFSFVVMVPPTDKHPAQVKELMNDVVVGTVVMQEWSSLITVSAKGDMLDRVEELMRAIKKARARANEVEIDTRQDKIGAVLVNYVFNGKPA